ncbi:MAG: methyl-accepting chemotaxis protein [Oligoflexia bacterium]|nr:methyl-accepting chemotaxis protein [Oligoflexia bacterium]
MARSVSLRFKLVSSFLSVAFGLLLVGGVGFFASREVARQYEQVVQASLLVTDILGAMNTASRDLLVATSLLSGASAGKDRAAMEQATKRIEEAIAQHEAAFGMFGASAFTDQEKTINAALTKKWGDLTEIAREAERLAKDGRNQSQLDQLLRESLRSASQEYFGEMARYVENHNLKTDGWVKGAERAARIGNGISLALVVVGFAVATLFGFAFSRSFTNSLGRISERLGEGGREMAHVSRAVSSTSEALARASLDQVSSVTQTAASIGMMKEVVSSNTEKAGQASEVMVASHQKASEGLRVVRQMIDAIEQINESNGKILREVETSSQEFSDIVKLIGEIGAKTQVINDIAFQTKLLSFNAAVEAARAGEHGMGFAVVADEVGNLAQVSATASKDITSILDRSIQRVQAIADSTKSRVQQVVVAGREKVEAGSRVASECGVLLNEIYTSSSEVSEMAKEISGASREQSTGIREISIAMEKTEKIAHENSRLSGESASVAQRLEEQARLLREIAGSLELTIYGKKLTEKANASSAPEESQEGAAPSSGPEQGGDEVAAA